MATPQRSEYITFAYDAVTLMCGSKAVDCYGRDELLTLGTFRGDNRTKPGVAGASVRPKVRGELAAELKFRVRGDFDDDNVPIAPSGWRVNAVRRLVEVRTFFDGAPEGLLTVAYTTEDGTGASEPVTFRGMAGVTWPAPQVADFRVLIEVPSGVVPVPT